MAPLLAETQTQMEHALGDHHPHRAFHVFPPVVAAIHTDAATAERLHLYIASLLETLRLFFPSTTEPIKLYVFSRKEELHSPLNVIEQAWLTWLMAADGEIGDSAMGKPFPVLGVLMSRKSDPTEPGVEVTVCPLGPAQRSGLQDGDRIVLLNDAPIHSHEEILRILASLPINSTAQIVCIRDREEIILPVTLDRYIDG